MLTRKIITVIKYNSKFSFARTNNQILSKKTRWNLFDEKYCNWLLPELEKQQTVDAITTKQISF